jgi:deoxycytidylate deaminase
MVMTVDLATPRPRGMQLAQRYALLSTHPKHKMGALIMSGKDIISAGYNKNRTHPRSPHVFCIHAEVDAILKNRRGLMEGMTMYVIRVTPAGSWGTSTPCVGCSIFMKEYGIEQVVYIDENGKLKKESL